MPGGAIHVLILGGTSEATQLARALAEQPGVEPRLSLAGRTRVPAEQPVPWRTGGFGGVAGLAAYLDEYAVDALVDATHPFAARITANAAAAVERTGTPLAVLRRPAWEPVNGDDWRLVPDLDAAAAALRGLGERVLITTGRDLAPFEAVPDKHYIVRTIDPPEPLPDLPRVTYLQSRGPFRRADEAALLADYGINALVTKNAGGDATRAKLDAAREQGVPVVMIQRPALPEAVRVFHDVAGVQHWLGALNAEP
ncbi:MAG: cobalt-precorrin-6A reductase [Ectothiorhodospiraceae bacterium]